MKTGKEWWICLWFQCAPPCCTYPALPALLLWLWAPGPALDPWDVGECEAIRAWRAPWTWASSLLLFLRPHGKHALASLPELKDMWNRVKLLELFQLKQPRSTNRQRSLRVVGEPSQDQQRWLGSWQLTAGAWASPPRSGPIKAVPHFRG